ncbi:hypothetical protein QJQ45_014624 [Haematococcus lacustris]|nr:hypothetical protein QJQ45_014624 [Haematococcus lacustris]
MGQPLLVAFQPTASHRLSHWPVRPPKPFALMAVLSSLGRCRVRFPMRGCNATSQRPGQLCKARAVATKPGSRQPSGGMKLDDGELDTSALIKYAGAVALQVGYMSGALFLLGQAASGLAGIEQPLAGSLSGDDAAKALVTIFFLVISIRSRIFSPLDASRPTLNGERASIAERRRPSWMPPPLTFPIVWSSIGLLRCASSVMVWEAVGRDTLALPLLVMMLHLAVGDCWNHINNVERRLGVAVPGVLCCLASALAVTTAYYSADTQAGLVLAPSAVWIGIASALIYSIWDLNGRAVLYPTKGESRAIKLSSSP